MARRRRLGARASLVFLAYAAGWLCLLAGTFANYALNELGHDEGMYLGASYLAMNHELYTEVGFFQAPNLPLLLSSAFAWSGVSELLLWGRTITFVHHAVTLALLAATAWHWTRSAAVAFSFAMWIGLNGFVFGAGYSIDNTTYASTYLVAAFYACVRARAREWPLPLTLLAGVGAAIAAGFKLSYVPLVGCFVVVLAVYAPRRALRGFVTGAVLGLMPTLYLLADRPGAFWFDNVTWHRALVAMHLDQLGVGAVVRGFASSLWHYLSRPTWLATIVALAAAAMACLVAQRQRILGFERTLLALMLVAAVVTVAGLGAVRFWYLQPVAIAGALIVPSAYSELSPRRQRALRWLLVAAVGASAWLQAPSLAHARFVVDQTRWVPARYHRLGTAMARLAPEARPQSVAAIGNPAIVYGVEGGLPLSPSAATGAFVGLSLPSTAPDGIETYARLHDRERDVVIATVDYVTPSSPVRPSAWCDASLPGDTGELVASWCDAGYERRVFGDGPSQVVVFYR